MNLSLHVYHCYFIYNNNNNNSLCITSRWYKSLVFRMQIVLDFLKTKSVEICQMLHWYSSAFVRTLDLILN